MGRSAHGTMTLMSSDLAQFSIPLPDKEIQQEIANVIVLAEKRIEISRRKHAALSALFHTLLHGLMTARIRVNNLDLSSLESLAPTN